MLTQQQLRDYCAHIFTETWLTPPDEAIALDRRALFRADKAQDYGRQRGGGLCVHMNNAWCSGAVKVDGRCSPDVEIFDAEMSAILAALRFHQCLHCCRVCSHGFKFKSQELHEFISSYMSLLCSSRNERNQNFIFALQK